MWTWIDSNIPGPSGPAGPPGTAGPSCVDFVVNSQADLDAIAPGTGSSPVVHTLPSDGVYCFGAFTLTAQHQIVVAGARKIELCGHGIKSIVQGTVDNGAVFVLQANATVHVHDFKIVNGSGTSPRALESATTEAYLHDLAISCHSGEGLRVTGGRLFANQLQTTDCATGVSCRGGEVFLQNYDCQVLTSALGVSIDAAHGGLQWIGGRCTGSGATGAGLAVSANCESIVLEGIRVLSILDFVRCTTGAPIVNRVSVIGNTADNTVTNGINWTGGTIPAMGLTILGNTFNVLTSAFAGFTHVTPRVNAKGNFQGATPLSETPVMQLFFLNQTPTFGSIAAGANGDSSNITMTGARPNDVVTASPRGNLANGLGFNHARVTVNDVVVMNLCNYSAGAITPAALAWDFCLTRFT